MPFNKSAAPLLALLHPLKRLVVIVLDLILAWVSVWAAFYLRVDQVGPTAVSAKVCLSTSADYPERPSPSLVIALGALLSALLAAAFVWRKLIIKTLSQDDANKVSFIFGPLI